MKLDMCVISILYESAVGLLNHFIRQKIVLGMHLRMRRPKSRTERQTGMSIEMKNAWRKSAVSPKIGNIFKKFPIFGETLLYLQQ